MFRQIVFAFATLGVLGFALPAVGGGHKCADTAWRHKCCDGLIGQSRINRNGP